MPTLRPKKPFPPASNRSGVAAEPRWRWASLLAGLSLLASGTVGATQWNEPFDQDVITTAEVLVRAEVVDDFPPTLRVLEVLAGEQVSGDLKITGFRIPGYYGEHALQDVRWDQGSKLYVFLARSKADGHWTLATPTSGVGRYFEGDVILGSVRISCAGVLFQEDVYRTLQSALFKALHGDAGAKGELERFARAEIGREPDYFGGEGSPLDALPFFRQHAALEALAMFPDIGAGLDLTPFLNSPDMHAQISAVRALAARDESTTGLIDFLARERDEPVPKMVAARALRGRVLDAEQRQRLSSLLESASEEPVDLCGGSIMDPRVPAGYSSVSVREAIVDALGAESP